MTEGLQLFIAGMFVLHLLACANGWYVLVAHPSARVCRAMFWTWVVVLVAFGGTVYAFDIFQGCDWDAMLAAWGGCYPCAWLQWQTAGC